MSANTEQKQLLKKAGFTFKQFQINHDNCAMKVGTDGILLGSWVNIDNVQSVADFGTGTGLIAIMLAQRLSEKSVANYKISAVELDVNAYKQAQENINQSKWKECIQLFHQDINVFSKNRQKCGQKFDLIVANPPYFPQGVDCANEQRNLARYTASQTHLDWLNIAENCLADKGQISFILPFDAAKKLIKASALYCTDYCEVITKQGKVPQRLLLTFSRENTSRKETRLVIYNERNQYTEQFIELTKAFYLNM
ncbi:tRNA1Val (adenine37-N6)-methyltransferase [Bisgaardia hudsonensis]|uniref:tRNA1(Val) (adenine(37)-N6)-methyltransferase n=1 Tax=Bisgaardia hudsonensis TaxID=109472 RepID=A0A4R2MZX8_9PAST|nr:tRNA1(Val) (adenine(37)-N6)-methyltransferase [Bisgaardia hudsonensis]QLB13671.1 tRNA (adenosine(37)-N6)-methyltransferase TrmM [Bisgaardia hudsonensis]TCP12005.1 tRNA1Val (adenine37-N6)-methyltransferase [Bisgaardia hudsonensis]